MYHDRDRIDRELMALLQEEARTPTSEIARRMGLARSTVNERIARLEKEGIILGYRAVIRPDNGVQRTKTLLHIRCERARCSQIVQMLRGFPEIRECVSVTGAYDLLCTVVTPCAEDVDALIDDLSAIQGVQALDATIILADKFERAAASPSLVA